MNTGPNEQLENTMEMERNEKIIVIGQDLFFLPRIQNAADPHGYEVIRATDTETFYETYRDQQTALILVDLEGNDAVWKSIVPDVATQVDKPRIVAFGHHTDVTALSQAKDLGCNVALTKGQFSRDLVKIVESRGNSALTNAEGVV